MAKFKVGDKVVIKDDLNFHGFENGEVIIIKEVDKYGGYTGYRVGDTPENWMCFDDREIEEYKEEVNVQKFKVGDLVKGKYPDRYVYTNDKMTKGMVISVYDQDFIRVKVLEHLDVASGFEGCEFDVESQYFDFYEEPKLVQKEKPKATVLKLGEYKIVFNGDTTVVTDGTKKGVAKRHPDDEYDAVVGLQVALERFHGGRKPKIGDKVRVLKVDGNSRYGRHSYSVGEIVTVIDFAYGDGGKGTDILCRNSKHGRFYLVQTLIAGEYEVLG